MSTTFFLTPLEDITNYNYDFTFKDAKDKSYYANFDSNNFIDIELKNKLNINEQHSNCTRD